MAPSAKLTERQRALLRWVGEGCPPGVMAQPSYRISAAALRNRGLITITGRGRTWRAKLTPAGAAYLDQLDGGSARRAPAPDPLALDFRGRIERHEVSRAQLERAVRLVDLIVGMARDRGWSVSVAGESENEVGLLDWSSAKDGHLVLELGARRMWLRLQEEGVRTRGALEDGESIVYDSCASGRLKLELRWGPWFTRQQRRWIDRPGAPLEGRLLELFEVAEARFAQAQLIASRQQLRDAGLTADQRAEAQALEHAWASDLRRARRRSDSLELERELRDQQRSLREAGGSTG